MRHVIYIVFIFGSFSLIAQKEQENIAKTNDSKIDTKNMFLLPDFEIVTDNNAYLKKYKNTKYYVTRVYAYSQIASDMLLAFQDTLLTIESKRKKRIYLKQANRKLKNEFGDEIKDMSITRGEYLMKLIYRETNMTTFEIIQMYRGSGKAVWFQALCRVNGQDLKRKYLPEEEDMMIEKVIREIEEDKIAYKKRSPKTEIAKKSKRNRKRKNKK